MLAYASQLAETQTKTPSPGGGGDILPRRICEPACVEDEILVNTTDVEKLTQVTFS